MTRLILNIHHLIPITILLPTLLLLTTHAYPIMTDLVDAEDIRCFTYNVPEDDDAHMVFVAIPETESNAVETYYVDAIHSLSKDGGANMIGEMPKMPHDVEESLTNKHDTSGVTLKVNILHGVSLMDKELTFHSPIVMRHVVDRSNKKRQKNRLDIALEGFSICFDTWGMQEGVTVLFDVVLVSDESHESVTKKLEKRMAIVGDLQPIEENFRDGIRTASRILREMGAVSYRELTMRASHEKRNNGVAYFSYLSVGVLFATSWMQITYLKSYFKKKKLM